MKKPVAILVISIFAAVIVSAQTASPPSKEEVLAKMDVNAKAFKSLDATIERREWDSLTEKVATSDSGKIYIENAKASPRIKLDITEPKKNAASAMIDGGKYQLYESATNSLRGGSVSSTDVLQLLLLGFGVTSDTMQKSFSVDRVTLETLSGETAVLVELQSKESRPQITRVRLWLSRKDWTPLKIELTKRDKDTWTFTYKDKKLNTTLPNKVFKLDVPSDAKRY